MRTRLAAAAEALRASRRHRDSLIAEASEAGMSRRAVAAAVGLSPAGVQNVLATERERRRADRAGDKQIRSQD